METDPNISKTDLLKSKPMYERIKIQCFWCGHHFAIRRTDIENSRQAVLICENCRRPIR